MCYAMLRYILRDYAGRIMEMGEGRKGYKGKRKESGSRKIKGGRWKVEGVRWKGRYMGKNSGNKRRREG